MPVDVCVLYKLCLRKGSIEMAVDSWVYWSKINLQFPSEFKVFFLCGRSKMEETAHQRWTGFF